jgi:hypothetical protein
MLEVELATPTRISVDSGGPEVVKPGAPDTETNQPVLKVAGYLL